MDGAASARLHRTPPRLARPACVLHNPRIMSGQSRPGLLPLCIASIVAVSFVVQSDAPVTAQAAQAPPTFPWAGQDAAIANPPKVVLPDVTFNPRDLSGVWLRQGGQGISNMPPKLTAAGEAIFKQSVPLESLAASQAPLQGNDPIMRCDPWGFPRVMLDFGAPIEFAHLPNRIVQFFEWTHAWRDIWLDGRSLPKDPDPRWMGYSVGRWEGNTLVVETSGLDARAWLDDAGHRHSGRGRYVERYRRIDTRTMEYDATLIDPEYYTEPWVGTRRTFRLLPMDGWPQAELREEFCAPSIEQDFNETIRDPAGGRLAPAR
jgi:hypothetical protein